ncbi:MAG: DUF1566 domain-containing protein, partial [Candidatus Electrothrix sp. AS4_5]|nr:DUF1566 domain-containing protein [Candidatus Electrothrix gigas]
FGAQGAFITQETAIVRSLEWMSGNPVMSKASQMIKSIETFTASDGYLVYVVQLTPQGFLILNSDDRLPLTVSYSADSTVNLTDDPQNAFRAMLLDYCERMTKKLANWSPNLSSDIKSMEESAAEDELYGPFLETTWNQNNPYNLLLPLDPSGSEYYDYRVPVGCTPTAYAQILHFHRWPYHGLGSSSYSDDNGNITGSHSAEFSDSYDWALMENSYDPWNTEPASSKDAVAELMYELGVAAKVDYEHDGTAGNHWVLGNQLGRYFFFESINYHTTQSDLITPMETDLRAGFPCVVSIPNHAVVADGLLVDEGITTYHINYGWGGENNGWFSADGVPGGALTNGVTSLRPSLLALPFANAVSDTSGETVELEWIVPKRRTDEMARIDILSLEKQSGEWSSDGSAIMGKNNGWEIVDAGRSGSCWYAENSAQHNSASLILDSVFVPDSSTELTFWQWAKLYVAQFIVEVSSDGGESYTEVYSAYDDSATDKIYESDWSFHSVSLSAYAGQEIKLRFSVSSGGWYDGDWPGLRLDDLAMTSGDWYNWESFWSDTTLLLREPGELDASLAGQPVYYTSLSEFSGGTYTLAARVIDIHGVAHGLSPSFTLTTKKLEPNKFSWNLFLPAILQLNGDTPVTGALNDTGITWSGNYMSGNNTACVASTTPDGDNVVAAQDCSYGRDVTHNDDSDGHAGFSYTKLDSNGVPLANQDADYATTPWACVKDNVTGLIWEVKTDDGGLHDKDDRYTWYNTDPATNGGAEGYADDDGDICYGYDSGDSSTFCNTEAYVNRVNAAGWCGASDWRMPTRKELESIVAYDRSSPAIDTEYFPNTVFGVWSGSPHASSSGNAWGVSFNNGNSNLVVTRLSNGAVRLVRGGQ